MKKYTFAITGIHCPSCEVLIEKKLTDVQEIDEVEVSSSKKTVTIFYKDKQPSIQSLNQLLKEDGYKLCEECDLPKNKENVSNSNQIIKSVGVAFAVILVFFGLNRFGLSGLVNVSASSSLPAFILLGLLAGISTCAALTGGIVLSMSDQWKKDYSKNESLIEKMKPHFLFNLARLVSYIMFGFFLGLAGDKLQLSLTLSALIVIAVSAFMFGNGLKMLGIKAFQNFQISLPKSLIHKISGHNNFQSQFMPVIMGALTILLPCGFTITVESLALLSGNPIQGALIMGAFAIGTLPGVLAIGFSSVKVGNSARSANFTKIAGAIVLIFAVFNINSQLNVLGLPSLNNVSAVANNTKSSVEGLAQIVDAKQVLKMTANASGYSPNYFKIRTGIPVRWEITDTGTSGCTNAVMSRGLFEGQIDLLPGTTRVKEFTVQKAGKYKFSCWMGMVTGIIEVIDQDGSLNSAPADQEVPSGAKGCGCAGGKI